MKKLILIFLLILFRNHVILFAQESDKTVDFQDSQNLYDKYLEFGAIADLTWILYEDHGFYEGTDISIELVAKFFKKNQYSFPE